MTRLSLFAVVAAGAAGVCAAVDSAALAVAREALDVTPLAERAALCTAASELVRNVPARPPVGAALAATWNESLAEAFGHEQGERARAKAETAEKGRKLAPPVMVAGPCLTLGDADSFGEDPLLASRLAVREIRAAQAHGAAVAARGFGNWAGGADGSDGPSDRSLNEVTLAPFRAAVKEADVAALATGRAADDYLVKGILRERWGFTGLVAPIAAAPDSTEVLRTLYTYARFGAADADKTAATNTLARIADEAIALLKNADGVLPLDTNKVKRVLVVGGSGDWEQTSLPAGVTVATAPLVATDCANLARPIPTDCIVSDNGAWEAEWFDHVREPQEIPTRRGLMASPAFALGEDAPYEGMDRRVFVVRWGAKVRAPESGDYAFVCALDTNGTARVTLDGRTLADGGATGRVAGQARLEAGEVYDLSVVYAAGEGEHQMAFGWVLPSESDTAATLRADAARADAVVVLVEADNGADAAARDAAMADVLGWGLTNLIVAVCANMPGELPWAEACRTMLAVPGGLGEATGPALARVVFGAVNPSGRLPWTWRREGAKPLFPFGHGLGYTTFDYEMEKAEVAKFSEGAGWAVSLPVRNIGERAGREVVQVYAAYPNAKVARPAKELKGFAKTRLLAPGESETLTVRIAPRDLAYWDAFTSRFRLDAGEYELHVGASAADLRGRAKITVAKEYEFRD